jgi:predicted enzyme related to lactoylglutathione lyase
VHGRVDNLSGVLVIGSIVIRVEDLQAQIAFWSQALGYALREPADADFALLRPISGDGPNVSLDAHHSERVLPPRIHLDLYAEDQAAEIARLTDLGARQVRWDKRPETADYQILEDPEGNRFCVVDASGWSGWTTGEPASRA